MNENTTSEEPWSCHDCGKQQELRTENGRAWYDSSGWYRAQLRPGQRPVYLDKVCFDSYNQDWPDYDGTYENSPWQGGDWQGEWLWALPVDYFARRDAYRLLPRWTTYGNGWKLVAHDGRILGWVEGYQGDARKKSLYRSLDSFREPLPGSVPMWAMYARGAVEVYLGLTEDGMVQR